MSGSESDALPLGDIPIPFYYTTILIINQYYLFTKFEFSQYPSQHINWLKNFGIFITINDKVRDIITIKMLIVKFSNVFFICTTYNYIYSFYYSFILILHNLVSFYIKFI